MQAKCEGKESMVRLLLEHGVEAKSRRVRRAGHVVASNLLLMRRRCPDIAVQVIYSPCRLKEMEFFKRWN
jgi:hypothetical protein